MRSPGLLRSLRFANLFLEILLTALQELQLFLHQAGVVDLRAFMFKRMDLPSQGAYRIGVMTESLPQAQEQQGEHW